MGYLTDFHVGETKNFNITIRDENGNLPDITGDSVWLYLKEKIDDTDAQAALSSSADVAVSGSLGKAYFALTPAQTTIEASYYEYEIFWSASSGDEVVLDISSVNVLERVADV